MNTGPHAWTDSELELFHDGELTGPRAEALADDLRASPELRARAARIARADVLYDRALRLERPATVRGPRFRPGLRVACAAVLLAGLTLLAGFWWMAPGGPAAPIAPPERVAREPEEPYRAIRVVFSIPAGEPGPAKRETALAADDPSIELPVPADFTVRLDEALAAGRVDEAIQIVSQAGPGDREEAYRRFGAALRSSDTAMTALDALTPEEQVAACKLWIAAGQQRPFAMARLKMLGRRPELESSIRLAVRELLADDPNLRTWVMSYVPWTLSDS